MSCSYAKWNGEYYECFSSGNRCMYVIEPNAEACLKEFGEGPLANKNEKCEVCQGFKMIDGKRCCTSTWGRCMFSEEIEIAPNTFIIDEDCVSCGGFKRKEE